MSYCIGIHVMSEITLLVLLLTCVYHFMMVGASGKLIWNHNRVQRRLACLVHQGRSCQTYARVASCRFILFVQPVHILQYVYGSAYLTHENNAMLIDALYGSTALDNLFSVPSLHQRMHFQTQTWFQARPISFLSIPMCKQGQPPDFFYTIHLLKRHRRGFAPRLRQETFPRAGDSGFSLRRGVFYQKS